MGGRGLRPKSGACERAFLVAAALLALSLAGCSREPRPNVLLVTFDTTRYDRFGCTGDPEANTPVVDRLAERGILFDRAYASAGLTLPSHTTMMTGLEPLAHGVRNNGRFRVPEQIETLAERLSEVGYATAAFVSAFVLDAQFRLDQGFDLYSDRIERRSGALDRSVPSRPGAEVTDEAVAWLEERQAEGRQQEDPYFLWAHYYDPHLPHKSREVPEGSALATDSYRQEISYADAQFGRLLEAVERLGKGRSTLVVFTADHGESLGEHGEATHGQLAYDSVLHVPLVVAGPGIPEGVRSDAYVRHADIVPTVLRAAGLPVADDLPGRDLVVAARAASGEDVTGYFESHGPHFDFGWAVLDGVRSRRWKYTATPEPVELYDVLVDPEEANNLAGKETQAVDDMARRYRELVEQQSRSFEDEEVPLAAADRERLAALGYVGAASAPAEEGPGPDPRRYIGVSSWVEQARALAVAGRFDEAISHLETLRSAPSIRVLVLRTLAKIYAEAGRFDDAVEVYREYIGLTGATEARLAMGRTLLRAGKFEAALVELEELGDEAVPSSLRALALGRLGRHAEARRAVDQGYAARPGAPERLYARAELVIDSAPLPDGEEEMRRLCDLAPEDPRLEGFLGYYLAVWGRPDQHEEAIRRMRAAADALPRDLRIQGDFGWALHTLGQVDEAVTVLERALEIDAGNPLVRFRLALALRAAGENDRAKELLRVLVATQPAATWADKARATLADLDREAPPRSERRERPRGTP